MSQPLGETSASASAAPSDEALLRRLRDGETSAGEMLVRRYHEPLMRYLYRLTGGNSHVAEELHQASWISVLEHVDRFTSSSANGAGGFRAWIFRIATNKANDAWRSIGRERNAKEVLRLVRDESAPDASHRLAATEESQKLLRAIESLPESQRQVLLLRYYGDMKFTDIARVVGCPLNTALGRMHKAMQKLKQLMDQ